MFNQLYEVHIMPLVINSLRRGHTNTHTRMHTQIRIPTIRTGSILRNQACTSLQLACAWFKKPHTHLRIHAYMQKLMYTCTVNTFGDSQPGIKSLTSSLYSIMLSGISTNESCGRVEFSVSSLLVNLINTPVLPVCCRV